MTVGLLLITHDGLGRQLLDTAAVIFGQHPMNAGTIDVPVDSDPDKLLARADSLCTRLDQGQGVLVLTDLYGSTPSNIAGHLLDRHNVQLVSGVSVPMLIRILNYAASPLEELAGKALSGARDGIRIISRN